MIGQKRKLTQEEKIQVLEMTREGKSIIEIARKLDINGQAVNGFVSTNRKRGSLVKAATAQTEKRRIAALKRESRKIPAASFSFPDELGRKLTISAFKGGIVIKIARKASAMLSSNAAMRFGMKINEMSNWVRV